METSSLMLHRLRGGDLGPGPVLGLGLDRELVTFLEDLGWDCRWKKEAASRMILRREKA